MGDAPLFLGHHLHIPMATIANLDVNLRANPGKLKKGMKEAGKSVQTFSSKAVSASKRIGKAFLSIGKAAAVTALAVVTAFAALVKQQFSVVDAAAKTAQSLGLTTAEFQQFEFVAKKAGVSSGVLTGALDKMNRRIANAASGAGPAAQAMATLGVNTAELSKLSTQARFSSMIDALKTIPNVTDRAQQAFEIFGDSARQLTGLLAGGSKEFAAEMEKAANLGVGVSEESAQAIQGTNDAMTDLIAVFVDAAQEVAGVLAPAFTVLIQEFTKLAQFIFGGGGSFADSFKEFIKNFIRGVVTISFIVENFGEVAQFAFDKALLAVVTFALDAVNFFTNVIPTAIISFGTFAINFFNTFAGGVGKVFKELFDFIVSGFTDPIQLRGAFAGLTDGLDQALADVGKSLKRKKSPIEEALAQGLGARGGELQKRLNKRLDEALGQFKEKVKKAEIGGDVVILPKDEKKKKEKKDKAAATKSAGQNAAFAKGSVEAFSASQKARRNEGDAQLAELKKQTAILNTVAINVKAPLVAANLS